MKDAEYRHFNAEKHRRNADFDVRRLDASGCLDGTSGGDGRYQELHDHISIRCFETSGLDRPTVCQNERKMTSLIAITLRNGLCTARSRLSWM